MVLKNTPLTWGRLCLLVSLCALQSLSAQEHPVDSPHSDRAWLTIGAGIGNTGGDNTPFSFGLAGGIGLTYQPGVVLFTARTAGMWNPFQGDFLGDVALLAGAGTRGQQSHASLAVGPALADGDLRFFRSTHSTFHSRLGLGIQAQILGLPLSAVGLGLTGFANLNSRQSFGGVMLSLGFGQVR